MSITVIREELVSCSPLGPVHTLDTVTAVFTTLVFSTAEQVRLTGLPSKSAVAEGEIVRVSCGGGTERTKLIINQNR